MLDINKIYFKNYKCFDDMITIEDIKPINIVIGKNNIGKSSFLDIIEFINDPVKLSENKNIQIYINKNLNKNELYKIFKPDTTGGGLPCEHSLFGKEYINKDFTYALSGCNIMNSGSFEFRTQYINTDGFNSNFDEKYLRYWSDLGICIEHKTKVCKRIFPERNINPELENDNLKIDGYGRGITTIVKNFLNKSIYDENKVKIELLNKFNEIMGCDAHFKEITTQQINKENENIKWEIFLVEENKGRIALSQSGSGLKTILMVLVYTILIPAIESKKLRDYIFLFEELENNLHPSLERRLLKYVEELSDNGATIFLTTHSNVILDSFQKSDKCQIYHILKENNTISINNSNNLVGKMNCLDDLGIKASDILQSNGIIWVEGPSDRIYINKWIELWSKGKYKEGMNYQCLFYGGKLASHLTINSDLNELVNILNVNKNSIIIIDSDKKSSNSKITDTKERIKHEFEKSGRVCWITEGKEIENYVPKDIIDSLYTKKVRDEFSKYTIIYEYLKKFKENEDEIFKKNKVKYARQYTNLMNYNNMKNILDINNKMKKVLKEIDRWNIK